MGKHVIESVISLLDTKIMRSANNTTIDLISSFTLTKLWRKKHLNSRYSRHPEPEMDLVWLARLAKKKAPKPLDRKTTRN